MRVCLYLGPPPSLLVVEGQVESGRVGPTSSERLLFPGPVSVHEYNILTPECYSHTDSTDVGYTTEGSFIWTEERLTVDFRRFSSPLRGTIERVLEQKGSYLPYVFSGL